MNKKTIEEKFESINGASQYIRVSDSHPIELYLGKNEKGFLTLRFNGDFKAVKVTSSGLIEIKQIKLENYNSILFSFTTNENKSLFYSFCDDVISKTLNSDNENAYQVIVNRYNQWRKMFFPGSKILSELEVIGLIGELLYLKDYAFKDKGYTNGLNGWSGPEPTHKDFSFDNDWIEIKTINSAKNSVHISSIEQLDSNTDGKLVVYQIEKMSPNFNGIKLNSLIVDIFDLLPYDTDKDLFAEKLKQVGYSANDMYDQYVYNFIRLDTYLVGNDFPRIKAEELPLGVSKVNYEIQLSAIERFKVN